jgi:hypothetical protein
MTKKQQILQLLNDNKLHYNYELKKISAHYKDYIAQFRNTGIDINTHKFGNRVFAYQIPGRKPRPAKNRSVGQLALF